MKRLITSTFLIIGFSFFSNAQCTLSISSTDTVVCEGDTPVLTATAIGPAVQLQASNSAGNNHRGNMFDIVATNSVTITSFDAFPMGNTTIEIYYKVGTWNGFANTPGAWTLVGSAPVTYTGGFVPVAVPVNITIPAGQTYAFYVTSNTSAVSLNYSNGTNVGNVYSSDANITFLEGGGMEYPFTQNTGAVYQPRVWNGAIHYALSGLPTTYLWNDGNTTNTSNPTINVSEEFTVQSDITGCPTMYDTLSITASIPAVFAGNDLALCAGDEVTLTGTGTESVAWDNSITDGVAFIPTVPTTFIVTGTDTVGCTVQDTVFVDVYALPLVNAGNDVAICSGDSIVFAGQGADSYNWNNGIVDGTAFVPVNEFTAIVSGIDINGCENTDTTVLSINALPVVDAGTDQVVCGGSEITLSGSGADSYMWNMGITDNVAFIPSLYGSYIVTGYDINGCADIDTVEINGAIVVSTVTVITNEMVYFQADQTGVTYQWIDCATGQSVAGETNQVFFPFLDGSYAVEVTEPFFSCSTISDCEVYSTVGISENELNTSIEIYPNPNNGSFIVRAETNSELQITDLNGRVIKEMAVISAETEIDLSTEESGVYFVKWMKDSEFAIKKVVVQSK